MDSFGYFNCCLEPLVFLPVGSGPDTLAVDSQLESAYLRAVHVVPEGQIGTWFVAQDRFSKDAFVAHVSQQFSAAQQIMSVFA